MISCQKSLYNWNNKRNSVNSNESNGLNSIMPKNSLNQERNMRDCRQI